MRGVLLVCLGGALGSGLRYLMALLAARWLGPDFPWGTLLVNVAGSFAIGFVQQLAAGTTVVPEPARLFLTVGLLGGLTTYSAFTYETVRLLQVGAWLPAAANVVATTGLCLAVCGLGLAAGRALVAP